MVGILYICTGKYVKFWKDFYLSAEKYLLPSEEIIYFVFTDADEIFAESEPNVMKFHQKSLGWPHNTLMRFHVFLAAETELRKCDYLYFANANTTFVAEVGKEIFPLAGHDGLVGVIHPEMFKKQPDEFPYERNISSTAYIPHGNGLNYYMGAFNGGTSDAYIKMLKTLKLNIDQDLQNDFIAVWWDESHLNHYLLDRNPLVLSPSYCYPEGFRLPFEQRLMIINKSKHGGHEYLRGVN